MNMNLVVFWLIIFQPAKECFMGFHIFWMLFRPEKHSVPWSHQTGKTIKTCSAHIPRASEGWCVHHMSSVLSRAVLYTQFIP